MFVRTFYWHYDFCSSLLLSYTYNFNVNFIDKCKSNTLTLIFLHIHKNIHTRTHTHAPYRNINFDTLWEEFLTNTPFCLCQGALIKQMKERSVPQMAHLNGTVVYNRVCDNMLLSVILYDKDALMTALILRKITRCCLYHQ